MELFLALGGNVVGGFLGPFRAGGGLVGVGLKFEFKSFGLAIGINKNLAFTGVVLVFCFLRSRAVGVTPAPSGAKIAAVIDFPHLF